MTSSNPTKTVTSSPTRSMTSSIPTKTRTRDGSSKASTGWWRARALIAVLIVAVTIKQVRFHTLMNDELNQLMIRNDQIFLPAKPMNSRKGSKDEAVRGNGTSAVAVAHLNKRPVEAAMSTLTGKRQFAKYAYAFVLGGCNPDEEIPSYRYFIYNIIVSARVLREAGSQADVVAFIQISYASTFDRLPSEDVCLLEAMNVRIKYIPKSAQESFYRTGKYRSCRLGGWMNQTHVKEAPPNSCSSFTFTFSPCSSGQVSNSWIGRVPTSTTDGWRCHAEY
jgi:hypothetical protein